MTLSFRAKIVAATSLTACALGAVLTVPSSTAADTAVSPASWGQNYTQPLDSSGEKTYSFKATEPALARFVLGNLPANYDLAVFDASMKPLKSSTRTGLSYEEVIVRVKSGKYFVKVTAPADVSSSPYTLVGNVYTKPTIINQTWSHSVEKDKNQYLLQFINPTNKYIAFTGSAEVYDSQGGFITEKEVASRLLAKPGGVGVSTTTGTYYYGSYWGSDVSSVKFVGAKKSVYSCESPVYSKLSNVKYVQDETYAQDYYVSGLFQNPRNEEVLVDATFIKYDAMGNAYEAYSSTLGSAEAKRKVSFSSELLTFTKTDVPTWSATAYVRYACE